MTRPKLILFTPGPVRMPPLVADYLADPPCNYHRQEGFRSMFAETEADLKTLVGIKHPEAYFATQIISTGTGANEACLQAFEGLGPGLILSNGFFGARLIDQAVQDGIAHITLKTAQDRPIDPAAVAATLDANPDVKWVYFVSHETRTGLVNPLVAIGQLCKQRGLMVGADVVSSAYAFPIDIEGAQLDLAVTSSAKAMMAVPGIGIVFTKLASLPALKKVSKPRGYYLDVLAECDKQRKELQPRFAQPVALHAALRAACIHMKKVGIDAHMRRIRRQMDEIIGPLEKMGVHAQLDPAYRSWIAVNFGLPAGLEYPEFARLMEAEGFYLLYGIPGDLTHFQVSTIGDLSEDHIAGLKRALTKVLDRGESLSQAVSY
jgi:2-aminoethylphosphonate-pyruvate transaminase